MLTLPIQRSDHSPLLLDTSWSKWKSKPVPRYEAVWLHSQDAEVIAQKVWQIPQNGSPMYALLRRQGILLRHLRNRSNLTYRSLQGQIPDARFEIERRKKSLVRNHNVCIEQALRKKLDDLLHKQEIYWTQRARVNWLKLGTGIRTISI